MSSVIELYCECGGEPEVDTERSNENWTVYKSTCTGCGEQLKMRTIESKNSKGV